MSQAVKTLQRGLREKAGTELLDPAGAHFIRRKSLIPTVAIEELVLKIKNITYNPN